MEYAEYLNEYLKTVDSLPADLEQSLTKMREIGLKNHIASRKCDQLVTRYTHRYPELKKSEQSEVVRQIRELNSKQKQFCDEQVKLATGTYELVDKHVRQLDATLARFEAELKDSKVFGGLQSNSPTTLTMPNFDSDALPLLGAASTASQSQPQAGRGSQKQRDMSSAHKQKAGTVKRDGVVESKRKRKLVLGGDVTPKGTSTKRKREDMTKVSVAIPITHSFISNGESLAGEHGPSTSLPSSSAIAPLPSGVTGTSAAASRLSVASLVRSIGGACGEVLDMPVDPAEPTYCVCHQVSFGEMVACDNPECPVEWFHFACVGLTANPRGKWFCPLCSRNTTKTPKPVKPATPVATAQSRVEKKPKKRD